MKLKSEYKEYLHSRHWRRLRMRLRRMTNICALCERELTRWETHHWTYKNIGAEGLHDLSILCPSCHSDAHQVMRGLQPETVNATFDIYESFWSGEEEFVRADEAFVSRVHFFLALAGECVPTNNPPFALNPDAPAASLPTHQPGATDASDHA